jgi:ubiquinone/menaquinone biosynthesis C-methylase UbiE
MSQVAKPIGFFGKLLAKSMAWGHKDFYKNTVKILNLKDDDKYLEIGFGSGLFINKYVSHVSKIAGLDYSKDMVNLASSINKNLVKSGKAEFKYGDASSLPWNDNEFSVVVAIETFYFWPDPGASIKEILRVLIPGGRLVIEMSYNKEDGLNHAKNIKKHNLKLYGSDEIKKILLFNGFNDIIINYFKGFWIPFKGYMVPKGMIIKAIKEKG